MTAACGDLSPAVGASLYPSARFVAERSNGGILGGDPATVRRATSESGLRLIIFLVEFLRLLESFLAVSSALLMSGKRLDWRL